MITGNKGEWSEIYALFKLLGDKYLYPGDENLDKIQGAELPIITVIRSETDGKKKYDLDGDQVKIYNDSVIEVVQASEFKQKAKDLLDELKESTDRTFSLPDIQMFMEDAECYSLTASSSVKTDITIIVHDRRTNQRPRLGFSIKSQLGSPSTLLNAGKTTNFIYLVKGIEVNSDIVEEVNNIRSHGKIKKRIEFICHRGGEFKYVTTERNKFKNNLVLIESWLPEILAELLLDYFQSKRTSLVELIDYIEDENPLGYDQQDGHKYYEYKIKSFLTDTALGMMPSEKWSGAYDATGGYLVVKEDGEVLCYHIYSRNQFEDYLLNNTKLETASSSRHGFGKLYIEDGKLYFKLNMQIRFIK